FHLFDEQLLRLLGGQARDTLQLALLRDDELLELRRRGGGRLLLVGDRAVARGAILLEALGVTLPLPELGVAREGRLLRGGRPVALLARLPCGLHEVLVRLLLRLEERLFFPGFRVAFRVLDDAERLFFGAPDRLRRDAFAVGDPNR